MTLSGLECNNSSNRAGFLYLDTYALKMDLIYIRGAANQSLFRKVYSEDLQLRTLVDYTLPYLEEKLWVRGLDDMKFFAPEDPLHPNPANHDVLAITVDRWVNK